MYYKSMRMIHCKHQFTMTARFFTTFIIAVVALGLGNCANIKSDSSSVECPPSPDGQSVLLPYPYDCNKYYHCVGEVPILRECPADLHFDASVSACNYPELAGCVPDLRVCEHATLR